MSLSAAFLGNATSCPKAGLSLSGTEAPGSPPSWGSSRRAGRSTAHLGILLGDKIHEAKAPVGSCSCHFLGQPHGLELSKGAVDARKSRDSMRGRERLIQHPKVTPVPQTWAVPAAELHTHIRCSALQPPCFLQASFPAKNSAWISRIVLDIKLNNIENFFNVTAFLPLPSGDPARMPCPAQGGQNISRQAGLLQIPPKQIYLHF